MLSYSTHAGTQISKLHGQVDCAVIHQFDKHQKSCEKAIIMAMETFIIYAVYPTLLVLYYAMNNHDMKTFNLVKKK